MKNIYPNFRDLKEAIMVEVGEGEDTSESPYRIVR